MKKYQRIPKKERLAASNKNWKVLLYSNIKPVSILLWYSSLSIPLSLSLSHTNRYWSLIITLEIIINKKEKKKKKNLKLAEHPFSQNGYSRKHPKEKNWFEKVRNRNFRNVWKNELEWRFCHERNEWDLKGESSHSVAYNVLLGFWNRS